MKKLFTAEAKWYEQYQYWKINVMVDGLRRSFYSKTPGKRGKKEAEAKAQDWADTRRTGDMPLDKAITLWLESKHKTLGVDTYKTQSGLINTWFLPSAMKVKRLSRIAPAEWQAILDGAAQQGKAAATIEKLRSLMLEFSRFCQASRWMMEPLNPDTLQARGGKPKKEKVILQPDALNVVFSVDTITSHGKRIPCWHIQAFRFACATGMRRGEICALRWDAITADTIPVKTSVNKSRITTEGKTENAQRSIALNTTIRTILEAQRQHLRKQGIVSPWVFPAFTGKQENPPKFYRDWKRYAECNALDERISFHCLRHTMISLYKDEVPEQLLKQVVGHSATMDTFGQYGHALADDAARTATLMDAAFTRYVK